MRFAASPRTLLKELQFLSLVLGSGTATRPNASLTIDAQPDAIALSAASVDHWLTARSHLPQSPIETGSGICRVSGLIGMMTAFDQTQDVTVSCKDGRVRLGQKSFRSSLAGLTDLTIAEEPVDTMRGAIELSNVAPALRAVLQTIPDTLNLNVPTAVLMEFADSRCRLVSTDGHRLTVVDLGSMDTAPTRLLIPLQAVVLLQRLSEYAKSDPVVLQYGDERFTATARNRSVRSAYARGAFPDFDRVLAIPKNDLVVRFKGSELQEAVRQVMPILELRDAALTVEVVAHTIQVTAHTTGERACRHLAADTAPAFQDDTSARFDMNARYVLQAVNTDEQVAMSNICETGPVFFEYHVHGYQVVTVVMPIKRS